MSQILSVVALALVFFVGQQTYESAGEQKVSLRCEATAGDDACLSIGSLGSVSPSGVRFWVESFVDHTIDLPWEMQDAIRKQRKHYWGR